MSTPNVERLEAALDGIRAKPEEHDQVEWAQRCRSRGCGTRLCLGGRLAVMAGYEILWKDSAMVSDKCRDSHGREYRIRDVARVYAGLSEEQATALFGVENTVNDLELMVKDLRDGMPIDTDSRSFREGR